MLPEVRPASRSRACPIAARHHQPWVSVRQNSRVLPRQWDAGDTTIAEYRYDPPSPRGLPPWPRLRRTSRRAGGLGRRITKLVRDPSDGKWDRTDYFYNADWQVLEERVARNLTAAEKDTTVGSPHVQYVWDIRYLDSPICRFRDANDDWDADGDGEKDPGSDGLEETLYYLTDANHNVTALVEPAGNVVERYLYDAYGRVHVLNGAADPDGAVLAEWTLDPDNVSDVSNEILYAGYRHDPETLLYHVRHRYLHATLGRWLTSDPAGYVDGMSLYEYCRSGPIGATDAMGQKWEKDERKAVDASRTASAEKPVFADWVALAKSIVKPGTTMKQERFLTLPFNMQEWALDDSFFDRFEPVGIVESFRMGSGGGMYMSTTRWVSNRSGCPDRLEVMVSCNPIAGKLGHIRNIAASFYKTTGEFEIEFWPGAKTAKQSIARTKNIFYISLSKGDAEGSEWAVEKVGKGTSYSRSSSYPNLGMRGGRKRAVCFVEKKGETYEILGCVYFGWARSRGKGAIPHVVRRTDPVAGIGGKLDRIDMGYPSEMRFGPPLGRVGAWVSTTLRNPPFNMHPRRYALSDVKWRQVPAGEWRAQKGRFRPRAKARYAGGLPPVYQGVKVEPPDPRARQ